MNIKKSIKLLITVVLVSGFLPAIAHAIAAPVPTASSASLPNTAVGAASIKLTWPSVTGAVGYQAVETDPNGVTTTQSVPYASGTSTYQTVFTNLTGGTQYKFTVTSTDSSGLKATSDQISQVAQSVPDIFTTGTPTVAVGSATLSWVAPTNNGGSIITGYTISEKSLTTPVTVSGTVLQRTITGLAAGHKYSFTIVATNIVGNSSTVTFADATVPDRPSTPAAPSPTIDPVVATTINVTWTAPTDNGSAITAYTANLYNSANVLVEHTNPATASTKFASVNAGTYTVKVSATNGAGTSVESAASAPVVVAAAAIQRANTPVITPSVLNALSQNGTTSVSATAPSGDTVTLTVRGNPVGACTITSGVITGVSPGTCTLTASVAASSDGTYAAGSVSKTFDISKASQSITFSTVSTQAAATTFNLTATASSGLTVTFAVTGTCALSDASTVSLITQGTCVVTASQAGNANYSAATAVNRTITITAAPALPSPAPSSSGGGGGSSGGGGNSGGLAPIATPTPSPTPKVSGKPTPAISPTPEATVTAKPTPEPTPNVTLAPTVKSGSVLPTRTIPTNSSIATVSGNAPASSTVKINSQLASQATTVKKNSTIAISIPSVPQGTLVTQVLTGPDGKKYVLVSGTTSVAGKVNSPTLKFAKAGTYTVTLTVGKVKKTVKIIVK